MSVSGQLRLAGQGVATLSYERANDVTRLQEAVREDKILVHPDRLSMMAICSCFSIRRRMVLGSTAILSVLYGKDENPKTFPRREADCFLALSGIDWNLGALDETVAACAELIIVTANVL